MLHYIYIIYIYNYYILILHLIYRNQVTSGKVNIKAHDGQTITLELTKELSNGIINFSNEFNLNELECLRLLRSASQPENKRIAEKFYNLPEHSLDGNTGKDHKVFIITLL